MYPVGPNIHVAVGTADGVVFEHQKGSLTWKSRGPIYSATKWVSGVALLRAAEEYNIPMDAYAHQYLKWWTSDPVDSRSEVTLRSLLGFTSGFSPASTSLPSCTSATDAEECAMSIYDRTAHRNKPGTTFDYNEVHIQLAGGLVSAATGLTLQKIVERYVLAPCGMRNTNWTGAAAGSVPLLGSALASTVEDYFAFLQRHFLGELLSADDQAAMETDQYPAAGRSPFDEGWHYGLTSWLDCPSDVKEWGPKCEALRVFSSGGTGGFRPQINRRYNYFLQIGFFGLPGIGGSITLELVNLIRPLINKVFESRKNNKKKNQTTTPNKSKYTATTRVVVDPVLARQNTPGLAIKTSNATSTCIGQSTDLAPSDCAAWIDLYDATGGKEWKLFSANRLDPCGAWASQGVVCVGGRVKGLALQKLGMKGPLPASIAQMSQLTDLWLSDNKLNGSIPASVASMAQLKVLHLIGNRMVGLVPALPFQQYNDCCIQFSGKNRFTCPLPPGAALCKGMKGECNVTCTNATEA